MRNFRIYLSVLIPVLNPVFLCKCLGFTADRLRVGSSAPGDLPYLSGHNLTMWTSLEFEGRDQIFVGTRRGDLVLLDVSDVDNVAQPVAYSYGEIVDDKVMVKCRFSYVNDFSRKRTGCPEINGAPHF